MILGYLESYIKGIKNIFLYLVKLIKYPTEYWILLIQNLTPIKKDVGKTCFY